MERINIVKYIILTVVVALAIAAAFIYGFTFGREVQRDAMKDASDVRTTSTYSWDKYPSYSESYEQEENPSEEYCDYPNR